VNVAPALTAVNVPGVGVLCPVLVAPQQSMVPSLRSAQLWYGPTLSCANAPPGGVVFPPVLSPQQAMV
jgi:hypothetical protein